MAFLIYLTHFFIGICESPVSLFVFLFARIVAGHLSPIQRSETTCVPFALYGVQQRVAVQYHRQVLDLGPRDPGFHSGHVTLKMWTLFLIYCFEKISRNIHFLPFLPSGVEGRIK